MSARGAPHGLPRRHFLIPLRDGSDAALAACSELGDGVVRLLLACGLRLLPFRLFFRAA